MARRMEFNVAKDQAGFPVVDAGTVEFDIKGLKHFWRTRQEDGGEETEIFGLTYTLEVTSHSDNAEQVGMTVPVSLYMHTPKTRGINKQFVLAGYGYLTKDERDFDDNFDDPNLWSIEFPESENEEALIPSGYSDLVGKKICAEVTKVPNKINPSQDQNQFRWFPFE